MWLYNNGSDLRICSGYVINSKNGEDITFILGFMISVYSLQGLTLIKSKFFLFLQQMCISSGEFSKTKQYLLFLGNLCPSNDFIWLSTDHVLRDFHYPCTHEFQKYCNKEVSVKFLAILRQLWLLIFKQTDLVGNLSSLQM